MSKVYGNSNKSTGRSSLIDKHPSSDPKGTSDEPFSQMQKVDTKEHHKKTLENMAAIPKHLASMPISDKHPYKRQSHAVKPAGPIQSFVGEKANISEKPKTKRPDRDGDFDNNAEDYD